MLYAVIDTNILVSALLSKHDDAATVQVFNKFLSGDITLLYSDEILKEYRDVLRRKKFNFSENMVNTLLSHIETFGKRVSPTPSGEILADMKDLPFYEIVAETQNYDEYLVTGNLKHFPQKRYIVTAKEFLEILKKDGIK